MPPTTPIRGKAFCVLLYVLAEASALNLQNRNLDQIVGNRFDKELGLSLAGCGFLALGKISLHYAPLGLLGNSPRNVLHSRRITQLSRNAVWRGKIHAECRISELARKLF